MDGPELALMERARDVRTRAYAPYSRFHVGAALQGADGSVHTGCNVENSSYGLTICAERSAVAAAVAAGVQGFTHLALSTSGTEPATPCGACRQVLAEFAPSLSIVSEAEGRVERWTLAQLLPQPFLFEQAPGYRG